MARQVLLLELLVGAEVRKDDAAQAPVPREEGQAVVAFTRVVRDSGQVLEALLVDGLDEGFCACTRSVTQSQFISMVCRHRLDPVPLTNIRELMENGKVHGHS